MAVVVPATMVQTRLPGPSPSLPPLSGRIISGQSYKPTSVAMNMTNNQLKSKMKWRANAKAKADDYRSEVGEVLGEIEVFRSTGESVLYKDLWDQTEGTAVVALLRHFGCPCCWELASALKEAKSTFDAANVKLIAVGIGTPNKARLLAERLPFPLECLYADPQRKAYDLLGLYYGIGRTFFNPASAKVLSRFDTLRKATQNYTIEATPDDASGVLQQGGMFVFKGKQLLYAWKDEGTGDHAPMDDIFKLCCSNTKLPAAAA